MNEVEELTNFFGAKDVLPAALTHHSVELGTWIALLVFQLQQHKPVEQVVYAADKFISRNHPEFPLLEKRFILLPRFLNELPGRQRFPRPLQNMSPQERRICDLEIRFQKLLEDRIHHRLCNFPAV